MATNFDKNKVSISGGIIPATNNTPGDIRTRIETLSEVESIPLPFVGMIFYDIETEKHYKVTSLKGIQNGPIFQENALVDRYEELLSNGGSGTVEIWTGTQSQYDAITNKDSNMIYIITQ